MVVAIRRRAGALSVLLLTGCDQPSGPGPGVEVRDSAGIQITESASPVWRAGEVWAITDTVVRIGGTDEGGGPLYRVTGAVRLLDGTLVIANSGTELRHYDPSGQLLRTAGRSGEGPGEFRAISWLGRLPGDSILTWDRGLNRFTVLAPTGEAARMFTTELTEAAMALVVRGRLSDGRLVLSRGGSFVPQGGQPGEQRQPLVAWIIDPGGVLIDSVGPFPGEAVHLRPAASGSGTIRTPIPFGSSTLIGAAGELVYEADTGGWNIGVYEPDRGLTRRVRRPHDPLAVRPEDVAAHIEARLEAVPPVPEIRAGLRASLEAVPHPSTFPALRTLRIDSEGNLWAEAERRPGTEPATWSVFDAAGAWLGDVAMPGSLEVYEIGADYVLGRVQDELGVESVVVLRLERGV